MRLLAIILHVTTLNVDVSTRVEVIHPVIARSCPLGSLSNKLDTTVHACHAWQHNVMGKLSTNIFNEIS